LLDSLFHVIGKTKAPVRDVKGLILTTLALSEAPQLAASILCKRA
jgi:hypothetical protein